MQLHGRRHYSTYGRTSTPRNGYSLQSMRSLLQAIASVPRAARMTNASAPTRAVHSTLVPEAYLRTGSMNAQPSVALALHAQRGTMHMAATRRWATTGAAGQHDVSTTIVYTCNKEDFLRLLRAAALAQCTFLLGLATIAPDVDWGDGDRDTSALQASSNDHDTGNAARVERTGGRNIRGWGLAIAAIAFGAAFVGAAGSIARRMVASLSLVERAGTQTGSRDRVVRIVTYDLFGKRTLEQRPAQLTFFTDKFAQQLEGTPMLFEIEGTAVCCLP